MKILGITGIMVTIDQLTKVMVRESMNLYQSIPVIHDFFHFTYVTNDGMAFGINFPGGIYIFSAVSLIFTVFLFWYLWKIQDQGIVLRSGVALILSGAIGNLIDRVLFGEVVDFLDFMLAGHHWYVFNIADSCVTVGMALILFDSFFLEKKKIITAH